MLCSSLRLSYHKNLHTPLPLRIYVLGKNASGMANTAEQQGAVRAWSTEFD